MGTHFAQLAPFVRTPDEVLEALFQNAPVDEPLQFTAFRIRHESRRRYSGYAANDPEFSVPLAA